MADRNAAKVLPDPVGAAIRTSRRSRISGQARTCGSVGAANRLANHRAIVEWKPVSDIALAERGLERSLPAPDRRDPLDRLSDLVVRRRGARRHADRERSRSEPPVTPDLVMLSHRPVPDAPGPGVDARRVGDVVGGHFLLAD